GGLRRRSTIHPTAIHHTAHPGTTSVDRSFPGANGQPPRLKQDLICRTSSRRLALVSNSTSTICCHVPSSSLPPVKRDDHRHHAAIQAGLRDGMRHGVGDVLRVTLAGRRDLVYLRDQHGVAESSCRSWSLSVPSSGRASDFLPARRSSSTGFPTVGPRVIRC